MTKPMWPPQREASNQKTGFFSASENRVARRRAERIVERVQEKNRLSDKGNARQDGNAAVIVLSAAEAEGRGSHEVVEGMKIRYAPDVSSPAISG